MARARSGTSRARIVTRAGGAPREATEPADPRVARSTEALRTGAISPAAPEQREATPAADKAQGKRPMSERIEEPGRGNWGSRRTLAQRFLETQVLQDEEAPPPGDLRSKIVSGLVDRARAAGRQDPRDPRRAPARVEIRRSDIRKHHEWMTAELGRLEAELARTRKDRAPGGSFADESRVDPKQRSHRSRRRRRSLSRSPSPRGNRRSPIRLDSPTPARWRKQRSQGRRHSSSDSGEDSSGRSNPPRRYRRNVDEWTHSPFSRSIEREEPPRGFQSPLINRFKGDSDPSEHIRHFEQAMTLHRSRERLMCRMFPTSFEGAAQTWFGTLPAGGITSWDDFKRVFTRRFIACSKPPRTISDLLAMRQRPGEGIRDYSNRFIEMVHQVRGCPERIAMEAFKSGLPKSTDLFRELARRPVESIDELTAKVNEHARLEDELAEEPGFAKRAEYFRSRAKPGGTTPGERRMVNAVFSLPLERIMEEVQEKEFFKWPVKLTTNPTSRANTHLMCHYHQTTGHSTEKCRNLRTHLDELASEGLLNRYLSKDVVEPEGKRRRGGYEPELAYIDVIHGLPVEPLFSIDDVRAQLQALSITRSVCSVSTAPKEKRGRQWTSKANAITFSDADLEGVSLPHEDSLLVTLQIGPEHRVRRLLIDPASGANIMYYHCFKSLRLRKSDLSPTNTGFVGFIGEQGRALGMITLPVNAQGTIVKVPFAVMDFPSPYNAILGKGYLHQMKAVASTLHQKFKWIAPDGVREVRGDQRIARQCLVAAVESLSLQPGREGRAIRVPKKRTGEPPCERREVPLREVEHKLDK